MSAVTYTQVPNLRNHLEIARPRVDSFERRMATLLQLVQESGSAPVCVTQPTLYYRHNDVGTVEGVAMEVERIPEGSINGVDYYHLRRAQDEGMMSLCRSVGAPVIDLASEKWNNDDFYDLMHNTPVGAKKIGQRIAATMKALP